MNNSINWNEVAGHLDALYRASSSLEALFPGRKFTLDGHLVGSIGEVVAAYMFGLDLLPASSKGRDATAQDGRSVEIKLTQGKQIAMRHEPEHLIVLQRPPGGPVRVVYNGPGIPAWNVAGKCASNGQCSVGLSRLQALDQTVADYDRLRQVRDAPV